MPQPRWHSCCKKYANICSVIREGVNASLNVQLAISIFASVWLFWVDAGSYVAGVKSCVVRVCSTPAGRSSCATKPSSVCNSR